MAEHSTIEWTDATWNPITGCSVISPGCTNCYAMKLAGGRLRQHASRAGLTAPSKAGPVWTGEVRLNADWLGQPLRWKRPRRIFVCAHGDLFHEAVPDAWIDQVFAVMALSPHHTFQVLTKRAARMRAYMEDRAAKLARFMIDEYIIKALDAPRPGRAIHARWPVQSIGDVDHPDDVTMARWPLPNVWLGVSAEDQARADERIPELRLTPAAVRFVSAEPLIGPIEGAFCAGLDWVIVGGESGHAARPMHPDWARQIRDACAAAGVPFFFKQWGSWAPALVIEGSTDACAYMALDGCRDAALRAREEQKGEPDWTAWWFEPVGKTAAGRILDGATFNQLPLA